MSALGRQNACGASAPVVSGPMVSSVCELHMSVLTVISPD